MNAHLPVLIQPWFATQFTPLRRERSWAQAMMDASDLGPPSMLPTDYSKGETRWLRGLAQPRRSRRGRVRGRIICPPPAAPSRQIAGILAFCEFHCLFDRTLKVALDPLALHTPTQKVRP